ncbi:MAG: transposase, partial [Deltaproteobacteria bacterium]
DLGGLKAFGMDETSARRGHRYVTVFIDLDKKERPVVFATPGKGTLEPSKSFFQGMGARQKISSRWSLTCPGPSSPGSGRIS